MAANLINHCTVLKKVFISSDDLSRLKSVGSELNTYLVLIQLTLSQHGRIVTRGHVLLMPLLLLLQIDDSCTAAAAADDDNCTAAAAAAAAAAHRLVLAAVSPTAAARPEAAVATSFRRKTENFDGQLSRISNYDNPSRLKTKD